MAKKLIKGVNDLQIAHPELVKEWHPTKNGKLTPYNVRMGQIKMRISPFLLKCIIKLDTIIFFENN